MSATADLPDRFEAAPPAAPPVALDELQRCFEGVVPAVVATVAADGTPNVTYLSRARMVDGERVALSNQFFSKTARNLAENPHASLLLIDPVDYRQFRLGLVYERTERRGPVFERLREDVDQIAALTRMQEVFKLRAADIYRVVELEQVDWETTPAAVPPEHAPRAAIAPEESAARLAELAGRLARCPDLDTLVSATLAGLDELLGYPHSVMLLLDEQERRLFTIGSHGYDVQGVGSEVTLGDGTIGLAAERCTPIRLGSIRQMEKYSRSVRQSYETLGFDGGREIPVPDLVGVDSQLAVPLMALGQLVGVLMVESTRPVAFTTLDEAHLTVVAAIVANAVEAERPVGDTADGAGVGVGSGGDGAGAADHGGVGVVEAVALQVLGAAERAASARSQAEVESAAGAIPAETAGVADTVASPLTRTLVKFYDVDGSTFVDGEYLIKGVAGRILWSVLGHHDREGRVDFTNKEIRLDPSLDLPSFRDNLDSRLLLLKRRLEERDGTIRLVKTGRGRFRLELDGSVRLESVGRP